MPKLFEVVKSPKVAVPAGAILITGSAAGVFGFLLDKWVYFAVFMLVLLAALLAYLIVAMNKRERDERSARGTGAADDMSVIIDRRGERRASERAAAGLDESFKKALAVIQARRLESLPWYLVIGPAGAGKTAFLRASGLELPAAVESLVENGPTSTASFWLANQAVLVDTAGRLIAGHEGADHRDWRQLLTLIAKHRRRPALQGVIVAVSAADLLTRPALQLEVEASELRRHLNEVVDQLGLDPPVYLVVTQTDRIQGFAEAAAGFAASRLAEAFGWTNKDRYPTDAAQAARDAMAKLRSRIELALPELLVREPDAARRARLALFPQELTGLGKALGGFVGRAFQPTRYDEVPFLRGIYLTSARREGELLSPALEKLGQRFSPGTVDTSGPAGGWFIRDLFRKLVLDPEEQSLAVVTERLGPRTRAALVAVAAVVALACVSLWGTSFYNNWRTIGRIREAADAALAQRRSLQAITELRLALEQADTDRAGLWHGFGLGPALGRAIARGRDTFAITFGSEFEGPAKTTLLGTVSSSQASAFAALLDVIADVSFLASRGTDEEVVPRVAEYATAVRSEADREAFAAGYAAFVRWAPEVEIESRIDEEQKRFDDNASQLLEIGRLETWCASQREIAPPVRPLDFGLPAVEEGGGIEVAGCYTKEFFERWLQRVFANIQPTEGGDVRTNLSAFRDAYARRYEEAWRGLVLGAPRPAAAQEDVMGSPYLALVQAIVDNTRVEGLWRGEAPGWVRALHEVRREDGGTEEKPAPWATYRAALESAAAEVERARGLPHVALDDAQKAANGLDTIFKKAVDTPKALIPLAPDDLDRTTKLALVRLLQMPVLNGFSAVLQAAAGQIDQEWKSRIVAQFGGQAPTPELLAQLCGPGGELEKFRREVLTPAFWTGTSARPLLEDRALPLSDRFSAYFASACGGGGGGPRPTGPQTVTLIGAPSEVTGASDVFVIGSSLALVCADGEPQLFEYSDGLGRKLFRWDPDGACESVSLTVRVRGASIGEQELTKEWQGPFAFARFLRSGQARGDGTFAWVVPDPYGSSLRAIVRYRRQGGDGILRFEDAASRTLPESVH